MPDFPNFYENLKEASMRLRGTIVCYDGEPYRVVCITNHKSDGIFRAYLEPVKTHEHIMSHCASTSAPYLKYPDQHLELGPQMDKWLQSSDNKYGILRKHLNSPLFKKFRPFPLGMVNKKGEVIYIQRQPNRKVEQGLIQSMVNQHHVQLDTKPGGRSNFFLDSLYNREFYNCVVGNYPDFDTCLSNLKDPEIANKSVAFDRHFALLRGPINMLFLAYKTDVIGYLTHKNKEEILLAKEFEYAKEVVQELEIFNKIVIDE